MAKITDYQYQELPAKDFDIREYRFSYLVTTNRRFKATVIEINKNVRDIYPIKANLFSLSSGRPMGTHRFTINGKSDQNCGYDLKMIPFDSIPDER